MVAATRLPRELRFPDNEGNLFPLTAKMRGQFISVKVLPRAFRLTLGLRRIPAVCMTAAKMRTW